MAASTQRKTAGGTSPAKGTSKKNTGTGKKPAKTTRRTTTSAARKKQIEQEEMFRNEIILWCVLAVSVIMFVSNFGIGGKIGNAVSDLNFGIFGLMAYVVPLALFIGVTFGISNKQNHFAVLKIVAGVLFIWFLSLFIELVMGSSSTFTVKDAFALGRTQHTGGGIMGGILAQLLYPNFGIVGAYIIDIIVLIISFVLLTERSVLSGIKSGGKKVYDSTREDARRRQEHRAERKVVLKQLQEEKELARQKEEKRLEQRRMDRKVSGVAAINLKPMESSTNDSMISLKAEAPAKTAVKPRDEKVEHPVKATKTTTPIIENAVITEPVVEKSDRMMPLTEDAFAIPEHFDDLIIQAGETMPVFDSIETETVEPNGFYNERSQQFEDDIVSVSNSSVELEKTEPVFAGMMYEEPEHLEPAYEESAYSEPEYVEPEYAKPEYVEPLNEKAADIKPKNDVDSHHAKHEPTGTAFKTVVKQPKQSADEVSDNVTQIEDEIATKTAEEPKKYTFPPVSLLKPVDRNARGDSKQHLAETAAKLQQTLKNFGVNVTITNVSCGPSVTRYELQPEMGVKVSKIVNLTDDIKLNLAAEDIRMEAPIPGKAAIGIEVPNKENVTVSFRELIESEEFQKHPSPISFVAGKDIAGKTVVADIAKMPHLLIAGATGSGKSVCINTIIMSIIYKADPHDVKLIMIDPKVVELSVYNGIPHLFIPVVTDPKKAAGALHWAVAEMTERYNKFAEYNVRDLKGYNKKIEEIKDIDEENKPEKMPQIVIIVDELADLMMVAPGDVEDAICRLAQLARAAGIHLIIATQRPSVNVITGLIKANMPSRIAFSVSSGIDSRTILDMNGAEKLLGKGDMLFYPQGLSKPKRVQGAFVSDREVSDVVDFLKEENTVTIYNSEIEERMNSSIDNSNTGNAGGNSGDDRDTYFVEAGKFLIEKDKASIGLLQRNFKVGFNRAARIMDQLEEAGLVGPEEGTKPRKILMSISEFENYIEEYV